MNQPFDFSPFDKHSKDEWIRKVTTELKGENPKDVLQWQHVKDLFVEPMYFAEDTNRSITHNIHGTRANDWVNLALIDCATASVKGDMESISDFCDGYQLDCRNESRVSAIVPRALESKDFIHFKNLDPALLNQLEVDITASHEGALGFGPLMTASKHSDAEADINRIFERKSTHFENFSIITIPGNEFVDQGASITQEIGIALALLAAYYELLGSMGLDPDTIVREIELSTSLGQDYFHEVAKLRAYRHLLSLVQESFGLGPFDTRINVSTSFRYKSTIEISNNLIRNTVEVLAATVGGCDTLCIQPLEKTAKSLRTALNVSNLLKKEAFMGRVMDPSGGSYYIENLTAIIAQKSWVFFQEIESLGGFLQARHSGWIDQQISQNRKWLIDRMNDNSINLINVNRYRKDSNIAHSDLFDLGIFRLAATYEREDRGEA